MKVTVNEEEEKENGFPKLMINNNNDLIVLMSHYGTGVVVSGNEHNSLGHYSVFWSMDCFKDFNGTVTLQND